jgi:hypothetical protein
VIIGVPPGAHTDKCNGIKLDQNHDLELDGDVYIAGVRLAVNTLQPGYARLDGGMWMTISGQGPDNPGQLHGNITIGYTSDWHNLPVGKQGPWRVTCRDLLVTAAPTGGSPVYKFWYQNQVIDGKDVRAFGQWFNINVNGKNTRIYSREQDGDKPMPNSGTWKDPETGVTYGGSPTNDLGGAPEAGLSNAQSFKKYGLAYGGEVAPCHASDPEIFGIECPTDATEPPTHVLSVKATASPLTVQAGGVVVLSAVVVDEPDDPNAPPCPNALQWSADNGTFANPTQLSTSWTAPATADVVRITATVTCADGEVASDTVSVQVTAADPVLTHYTGVPTGTSVDGGKTITPNPPSEWNWTPEK